MGKDTVRKATPLRAIDAVLRSNCSGRRECMASNVVRTTAH